MSLLEKNRKPRFEMRQEYMVCYTCDIISGESGDVIDYHSEDEVYPTLAEAKARAEQLRQQIGEEICSWGDDVGVLREVYVDDEPRGNQYVIG